MASTKKHSYDLGIIGNCSYLAYVNTQAEISWMCWPSFDSNPVFYGLLDSNHSSSFSITPFKKHTSTQSYIRNTNILITEFHSEDGAFQVIDFAPRFELFNRTHRPISLFRKIQRIEGTPLIKVCCQPKEFPTGENIKPVVGSNHISFKTQELDLRLTSDISKHKILDNSPFALTQDHYLAFTWGGNHLEAPLQETFEDFLQKTIHYWESWIRKTNLPSIYQEEIIRSALILKMHQDEDSGAIIASGTTSLPEYPNSGRTWDYRFCWIRDSYFTLSALYSLGHFSEIEKYSHYIQNIALQENEIIHPVYKINSQAPIPEIEFPTLPGYKNEKPVRLGNAAYNQIQNDSYGQILLSLLPLFVDKRVHNYNSKPSKKLIHKLLRLIEQNLRVADAGIWEYRNQSYTNCSTALFQWAGAMSAKKIGVSLSDNELISHAEKIITQASDVIESCYSNEKKYYKMAKEVDVFDASLFLLSSLNYLPQNSEKLIKHTEALKEQLEANNGLFYRYKHIDDFGETHAAFLVCSFWFIESLCNSGNSDLAQQYLAKILKHTNHLGIFSEDIDPLNGSQWGNFGQTYSHVGLINAAFKIAQARNKQLFEL